MSSLAPDEVFAAADDIIAAFAATDGERYFAGFHPDATFFFHTEPALVPNRAAYESLWEGWVAGGWRVVSCESTLRAVAIVGDTGIFTHTVITTTAVGGVTETTHERESIVFTRIGESLLAVHEHLSAEESPE